MNRVLFIQPPFFRFIGIHSRYFPYQFVSMGTYLKKSGHLIRILEGDKCQNYGKLDFSDQEAFYANYLQALKNFSDPFWRILEKEIQDFEPDYIGVTVWTTFIASAIRTAEYCKRTYPSAIIIAGGPHVTLLPENIKNSDVFDIGVIGEGEQSILEIVNGNSLDSIEGIFYRDNGTIRQTKPRVFVENLDDFGIPDRTLLNEGKYEAEDMGLIMTSRGCPFSCSYCATAIWKNKVRARSINNIIEEIRSVTRNYGTIYFTIKDDSFTVNRKRVYDFCNKINESKLNIYWECNANLSTLDKELLVEMRSAGCIAMKVGIESGSDRIHKIINKKINNEIIISKMKMFDGIDMHVTCYFMMGIPSETKNDILKTLNFAYKLKPDFISFSVYEIFPGTKLHKLGIEENSAIEHMAIEDYFKIQPHNYFFANHKRQLSGMTHDEFDALERYIKQKVRKYNRSPYRIYCRIKSRLPLYRKSSEYFFNDIKQFFKWV